jgi:pilus assembly protein Flp/PilA
MGGQMSRTFALTQKFVADESGATAIEYGLVAALISVAIIAALTLVGGNLGNIFNSVGNTLGKSIS